MLKYVKVDSDGYAWLDGSIQRRLHKSGYAIGRFNDEWLLFRLEKGVSTILYETTDHILFDNYLKLLMED